MSRISYSETAITCPACGVPLIVRRGESDFGPENAERETANCPKCRAKVDTRKCFSLEARLTTDGEPA